MRLTPRTPGSPARSRVRRGATMVEFAVVMPFFMLFVFGVYEYGRYLMTYQVVHNAARDAARWGVVRGTAPEAETFSAYSPLAGNPPYDSGRPSYDVPFITTRLLTQTVGVERNISNFQVRVYTADPATLYADPPLIQPKAGTTSWNAGSFSERLAVQVVGRFTLMTPNLLFMNSTDIRITALSGLEG